MRSPIAACDSEVVKKLENYNKRIPHHNLQLKPGKYKIVVNFQIGDEETDNGKWTHSDWVNTKESSIIEFTIITFPIQRKSSIAG